MPDFMGPDEIDCSSGSDLEQLVSVSSERVKDDSRQTLRTCSPDFLVVLDTGQHNGFWSLMMSSGQNRLRSLIDLNSSSIDPGTLSNTKASVVEERQLHVDERFHASRSIPKHVGEIYSSLMQ